MRILIVKTSSLGDIVHAFPALSLLKKKHPDAEIDWVVEKPFTELLEAHPFVNRVIPVQTKKWRKNLLSSSTFSELKEVYFHLRKPYDLLFDLQGNTKSAMVTAFANAKTKIGYGIKTAWEYPNLLFTHVKFDPSQAVNVRDENLFLIQRYFKSNETPTDNILLKLKDHEKNFLQQFLAKLPGGRKVFVAPGSNWKNKQVNEDALTGFLQLIHNQQYSNFLLVYGNEQEKLVAERISAKLPCSTLVDKLSLPLLQNLMGQMDFVIAMDSLPLHLAATAGVRTFGIFGPSSSNKYAPTGSIHSSVQGTCPYNKVFTRRCAILRTCATGSCIKSLSAQALFDHFNSSFS